MCENCTKWILTSSGCDTVPQMSGVGKKTILKILKKNLLSWEKVMFLFRQ